MARQHLYQRGEKYFGVSAADNPSKPPLSSYGSLAEARKHPMHLYRWQQAELARYVETTWKGDWKALHYAITTRKPEAKGKSARKECLARVWPLPVGMSWTEEEGEYLIDKTASFAHITKRGQASDKWLKDMRGLLQAEEDGTARNQPLPHPRYVWSAVQLPHDMKGAATGLIIAQQHDSPAGVEQATQTMPVAPDENTQGLAFYRAIAQRNPQQYPSPSVPRPQLAVEVQPKQPLPTVQQSHPQRQPQLQAGEEQGHTNRPVQDGEEQGNTNRTVRSGEEQGNTNQPMQAPLGASVAQTEPPVQPVSLPSTAPSHGAALPRPRLWPAGTAHGQAQPDDGGCGNDHDLARRFSNLSNALPKTNTAIVAGASFQEEEGYALSPPRPRPQLQGQSSCHEPHNLDVQTTDGSGGGAGSLPPPNASGQSTSTATLPPRPRLHPTSRPEFSSPLRPLPQAQPTLGSTSAAHHAAPGRTTGSQHTSHDLPTSMPNTSSSFTPASRRNRLPLAPGWKAHLDARYDRRYYHNVATNESTWEYPERALPQGWTSHWDQSRNLMYYHHAASRVTQWQFPQ